MSVAAWLAEATPDRREVGVCLDRALLSRLQVAEARLGEVQKAPKPPEGKRMLAEGRERLENEASLQAEVDQLRAEVKAKTRTLVFEGIGWGAWRDLMAKHPPDPEQAEVFEKAVRLAYVPFSLRALAFNAQTFWPAAISASCPELTEDQAATLLELVPAGVFDRIQAAVLAVNGGGAADPFALGVSERAPATARR